MTYQEFDAWLVERARELPIGHLASIPSQNYLDINRHISHIRNQPGNNWLALALSQIQIAVRAVQKAVT